MCLQHYVDLNDPYVQMNNENMNNTDFLGMLSPPSFDLLSTPSPRYVNVENSTDDQSILKTGGTPDGYLCMDINDKPIRQNKNDNIFKYGPEGRYRPNMGEYQKYFYNPSSIPCIFLWVLVLTIPKKSRREKKAEVLYWKTEMICKSR